VHPVDTWSFPRLSKRESQDEAQAENGEEGDFQCSICFEPFLDNERITCKWSWLMVVIMVG
jgi:hypothetical protein